MVPLLTQQPTDKQGTSMNRLYRLPIPLVWVLILGLIIVAILVGVILPVMAFIRFITQGAC